MHGRVMATISKFSPQNFEHTLIKFVVKYYSPGADNSNQIKAVTSCSTHKIDQQETDG